jgi:hypothetical protein
LIIAAIVTPQCGKPNNSGNPNVIKTSIWISVFVSKTKENKMADIIEEFNEYRSRMNEKLLADNKIVKKIFNLDTNAYAGAIRC